MLILKVFIYMAKRLEGSKKDAKVEEFHFFFRIELKDYVSIIGINDFGIAWLKINNNIIDFDEDVFI